MTPLGYMSGHLFQGILTDTTDGGKKKKKHDVNGALVRGLCNEKLLFPLSVSGFNAMADWFVFILCTPTYIYYFTGFGNAFNTIEVVKLSFFQSFTILLFSNASYNSLDFASNSIFYGKQ